MQYKHTVLEEPRKARVMIFDVISEIRTRRLSYTVQECYPFKQLALYLNFCLKEKFNYTKLEWLIVGGTLRNSNTTINSLNFLSYDVFVMS
jgi:hypothetical protein